MEKNKLNKYKILAVIIMLLIIGLGIICGILCNNKNKKTNNKEIIKFTSHKNFNEEKLYYKDTFITSKDELKEVVNYYKLNNNISYGQFDFKKNNYLVSALSYNSCSEEILGVPKVKITKSNIHLIYTIKDLCGFCGDIVKIYFIPFDKNFIYDNYKIKYSYNYLRTKLCDEFTIDKPIIYIYPTEKIDLRVKLLNNKVLTSTYPKYNDSWDITVDINGNIYDKKTNRNYYALYWEGIDNTKPNMTEGFVIKGKDTISFLEEKLKYLGLNEREINEFIVYWLPKMENNKYNFIRFKTIEEANNYMPLKFSKEPDTLIRVLMDFKPLNKEIKIKEQKLIKQERKGFTIVEWGGRELKEVNYEK